MSEPVPASAPNELVEDLFRRMSGRLVAQLVRRLGSGRFDVAEDAVQHALLQALRRWPFHGVPSAPEAWLTRAAWNRALDTVRAEARSARLVADFVPIEDAAVADPRSIDDDELRLLFACCHPEIPEAARVALALKSVCGFGIGEIARAFLVDVPTVQQRLLRAKQLIAKRKLELELPSGAALVARRAGVLAVLYLIFNEGYSASAGDQLVRPELCAAAIRLCDACAIHPLLAAPEVHALLALMLLQAARLDARVDVDGTLIPLADQDRTRWSHALIARGHRALVRAQHGNALSTYHLQAGVAALHASAPSWAATDWHGVCEFYDLLVVADPSPVVRLNRAIAIAERDGPAAALTELRTLQGIPALRRYSAVHGALGESCVRLGAFADAVAHFAHAAVLARTLPEQRHFERQRHRAAAMCTAACGGT